MSFEATAIVLAWGAILLLALAMAGLVRQVRYITIAHGAARAMVGPSRDQLLPAELFDALSLTNSDTTLVFMDRDCDACTRVLPELERLAEVGHKSFAVVFRHAPKEQVAGRLMVVDHMAAAFERLRVPVTPYAVRVGARGEVTDAAAVGSSEALHAFAQRKSEGVTV